MIVYNVGRHWFAMKDAAEKHRVSCGLKPAATLTVEVSDRHQLCALMNALCNPPSIRDVVPSPATPAMVEAAYVDPHLVVPDYIPKFLVREAEEREALHKRVQAQKGKLP